MYVSWTQYSCNCTGTRLARETCENCRTVYLYNAECRVTASVERLYGGNAKKAREAAEQRARALLQDRIKDAFDIVPCPKCGRLQPHMVEELRRRKFSSQGQVAMLLIILGLVMFGGSIIGLVFTIIKGTSGLDGPVPAGLAAVACLAMVVGGFYLRQKQRRALAEFDPNLEPAETRIREGKVRAVTLADFEAGVQPPSPGE